jgi:thiol-disulfide isomerase/thioredoxin
MFTKFSMLFSSLFLFFILESCCVAETQWDPEKVPTNDVEAFLFYYQHFLHAKPFPIEANPNNEEEKRENVVHHRQLALLYGKLSEAAGEFARTAELPAEPPNNIKKDRINKIPGSWNLYKNIPVNAVDLWAESCFLKYQSLDHESRLDSDQVGTLHEFATEIEPYPVLAKLFQDIKRRACLRSLSLARQPLKDHEEKPEQKLTLPSELAEKLIAADKLFSEFLKKYPNEDNMKITEVFLDTVNLFRSFFPESERLPEMTEPLREVFADVQKRTSDPLIHEYTEVYEGTLRRQELVGKPMPIWGTDCNGNIFDAKTLDGKVVLLDFWATWCGPCIGEFPHLKKLYKKYHDKGFEIIGFSVDSDFKKLTTYLKQNPLPWTILSKEITKQAGLPSLPGYYGAKQLPVVLLRDQAGNAILLDARGEKLDDVLEKIFDKE